MLQYDCFGPYEIGMNCVVASKALAGPLMEKSRKITIVIMSESESGFPGISFMVTRGRISRVHIDMGRS